MNSTRVLYEFYYSDPNYIFMNVILIVIVVTKSVTMRTIKTNFVGM